MFQIEIIQEQSKIIQDTLFVICWIMFLITKIVIIFSQ